MHVDLNLRSVILHLISVSDCVRTLREMIEICELCIFDKHCL